MEKTLSRLRIVLYSQVLLADIQEPGKPKVRIVLN